MRRSILYAGDSEIGGSANYLLAVLRFAGFQVRHIPPGRTLTLGILKRHHFEAIILSDFPEKNCPFDAQKEIKLQVMKGAGLMMVGGWASFSGPFGGWSGSHLESILPVQCLKADDRFIVSIAGWLAGGESRP